MPSAAIRVRVIIAGIALLVCLRWAAGAEPATRTVPFAVDAPADAMLKLRAAHDLAQKKDWVAAAGAICDVADLYPDSLVPAETDDHGNVSLYRAAYLVAREELARWPAEGMAKWREIADARAELHSHNHGLVIERLHHLRWYPGSQAQRDAGLALLKSYDEEGRAPARITVACELLAQQTDLKDDLPAVLCALGQALHETGDAAGARQQLDELKARYPEAKEPRKGEIYADTLARTLAKPTRAAPSWPMLGGAPDRSRIPQGAIRPGEVVWSLPVPPPPFLDPKDPALREAQTLWEKTRKSDAAASIFPALEGDELYYQNGYVVGAVDVKTGKPLAGWLKTSPQDGCFRFPAKRLPTVAADCTRVIGSIPAHHVTLTADSVFAILGAPDLPLGAAPQQAEGGQWLTCLNRATGAVRWEKQCRKLVELRAGEAACLVGSPIVVGSTLHLTLVLRGDDHEEEQIVCHDISDGRVVWKRTAFVTPLGAVARAELDAGAETAVPAPSYLAYADGTIYAGSQRGAVAAVDAISGWIAFVTPPFETRPPTREIRSGWRAGPSAPSSRRDACQINPVMIAAGKLFALAGAGHPLIIRDAATGKEVKRIEPAIRGMGSVRSDEALGLLAVSGDEVVVWYGETIAKLNWAKWNDRRPEYDNPGYWRNNLDRIRGRGIVTRENVWVATASALDAIDLKNGKVIARWPQDDKWPADQCPGNILVAPGRIIVAGPEHLFALGAAPEAK